MRMILAALILIISLSINNTLNFSLPTVGAYLLFQMFLCSKGFKQCLIFLMVFIYTDGLFKNC